jgi:hypothetical protein
MIWRTGVIISVQFAGTSVSIAMIMNFFCGSESVPPCGFPPGKPVLSFNAQNPYPTASTCAIELTLPTRYAVYQEFKEKLDQAFKMHGGFGLV